MKMANVVLIFFAGGLGSICRAAISHWWPQTNTLLVNITGSLLIGLIVALADRNWIDPNSRLILCTGFLGGFTTFSAFSLENVQLVQQGNYTAAVAHALGSMALGVVACAIGLWLGQR